MTSKRDLDYIDPDRFMAVLNRFEIYGYSASGTHMTGYRNMWFVFDMEKSQPCTVPYNYKHDAEMARASLIIAALNDAIAEAKKVEQKGDGAAT